MTGVVPGVPSVTFDEGGEVSKCESRSKSRWGASAIATKHPLLSNYSHGSNLPPNWTTLYDLTRVPLPILEEALEDGRVHRRHLKSGQLAAISLEVEKLFATEAKKRQAHGQTAPGKPLQEKIPQAFDKGQARDKAAEMVGVSPRSPDKYLTTGSQILSAAHAET